MICDDYDGVWSKIFKKSKNRNAEKVPPTGCPCQPPTLGNFRRLLRVRFSLVLLLQAARTSTSKKIKSEGGVPDFRYRLLTAGDSTSPRLWEFLAVSVVFVFFRFFVPQRPALEVEKIAKVKEGSSIFAACDQCRGGQSPQRTDRMDGADFRRVQI